MDITQGIRLAEKDGMDQFLKEAELTMQSIINDPQAKIVDIQSDNQETTRNTLIGTQKECQELIVACNVGLSKTKNK